MPFGHWKHWAAATAALAAPASSLADTGAAQHRVLAIVAHPDDELFIAPALAAETRRGSQVIIIYATSGDAGPGVSAMEKGAALARKREREAACAAEALGGIPHFLRFGDGQLAHHAGSPESTAAKLRKALREEIASRSPHVIMTWGADGGYGHPDHRMVSSLVTEIVQSLAEESRPLLLYSGIASGRTEDAPEIGVWAETAPDLLTVSYSYTGADMSRSSAAAQCHETQFDAASRAGLMPLLDARIWQGEVTFREAF